MAKGSERGWLAGEGSMIGWAAEQPLRLRDLLIAWNRNPSSTVLPSANEGSGLCRLFWTKPRTWKPATADASEGAPQFAGAWLDLSGWLSG
jgi:hypothetical protein